MCSFLGLDLSRYVPASSADSVSHFSLFSSCIVVPLFSFCSLVMESFIMLGLVSLRLLLHLVVVMAK